LSEYGRDGLLSAAFTGNATVAKLMLALGPEAKLHKYDALGNTPLHLAAFSGHASVVQVLLDTPSMWHDISADLFFFPDP
jgi:ankyrin repeat protein